MLTTNPRTVWEALTQPRFLRTGWPWRAAGYMLTTPPVAGAAAVPMACFGWPWLLLWGLLAEGHANAPAVLLLPLLGSLLILTGGPLVAMPVAALERLRLRILDPRPTGSGHRPVPPGDPVAWLRTRYCEPATWRELGYLLLLVVAAPPVYAGLALLVTVDLVMIASPVLAVVADGPVAIGFPEVSTVPEAIPYAIVGLVLLPVLAYLLALVAAGHGAVARALLQGPPEERLRAQLVEVSQSRARLVDAFGSERRRIERDLHDGAQQRLVGLTLKLGLARLDTPPDSPAAAAVADAHEQAKQLLTELRELIHGIHPKVLTDRGLPAALQELADRLPVPVQVDPALPGRLPAPVEETAYFVVAEALANAARHSAADTVQVTARVERDHLVVEVTDDGRGGADPQRGTGLAGLADRVAALGGRMFLSSPPGGPTLLRAELPCRQHRSE